MEEGARVWDLHRGRELAVLPAPTPFAFFDTHAGGGGGVPYRGLLTGGAEGLLHWPVTCDDPAGQRLRLGPPRRLSPLGRVWFARRPDGGLVGAATQEGGVNRIVDLETGAVRRELGHHPQGEVRAVSADGRWAASSGWHSDEVRLWDARTGREARKWTLGKRNFVTFTPDSRTLIICRGDAFSFWDVETLQLVRHLPRAGTPYPGQVAFSPDGRLMALEMAPAVVHLNEVSTNRTVAKLMDPLGDTANWLGFTPDGAQLVVVSKLAGAIHVWDLRAIRTQLQDMNLDWDWPAFAPAAGKPAAPVSVEVELGDLANASTRAYRARQAIERYRRIVKEDPNTAWACNALAWAYLTAPAALRDVKAAVPLAEKAVQLSPKDLNFRNTLGVAYYRAGRYREAAAVLRANVEKQEDGVLAFDLYFLAMSHHRLGEPTRARDYYDWAIRWVAARRDPRPDSLEELNAIRAEAEELLGIDRK